MSRWTNVERRSPERPDGSIPSGARLRRPGWSRGRRVAVVAVVGVLAGVGALTGPGAALAAAAYRFLEFYSGVFALVALSLTVMGGFIATDRSVLLARHRVLLQTAHRLTAVLALSFLAVHITLKVAEAHASVFDVVVPFLSPHRRPFVGLGTIALYLMVLLAWTGLIRARFAQTSRPWLWRAMHVAAYPAWLLAIVHGLGSGRHAAGWVTASYVLCAGAVSLGVLIRVGVARGQRGAGHTTGSMRPVPPKSAFVAATAAAVPSAAPASAMPARPVPVSPVPARPAPVSPVPARPVVPPVAVAPRPAAAPLSPRIPIPPPAVAPPPPPPPRRRRAPRVPPAPRRSMEDATDEEFWKHIKGDTVR